MEHSNIKPNEKRAKIAIHLIWVVVITQTVAIFLEIIGFIFYGTAFLSEDIIPEYHHDYFLMLTLFYALSQFVVIVAAILSAITFIMWFRRAYYNLHKKTDDLLYGEGWAAGCWFIPIGNLYMPYQIMKELYKKTDLLLSQNLKTCSTQLTTKLLPIWWTLWILTRVLDSIVMRMDNHIPLSTILTAVGLCLTVIMAIVITKIIKSYNEVEPFLGEIDDEENEASKI